MSQNIQAEHLDQYLVQGVEFVGLVTKNGRLVDYRSKSELEFSDEQKEMFFMSISLHESMQRDFDNHLGPVKYTITEREKYRVVSIPYEQDAIILIMNGSFASTIRKIKEAIAHAKNQNVRNKKGLEHKQLSK